MKEPTNCALWRDPKPAVRGPLKDSFELLETFLKDSHWWRYLLKCRECGQLYFFEFKEEVDWEGGDDPQFSIWIPVDSEDDIKRVRSVTSDELRRFRPSLRKDWPKEAAAPKVYWVRAGE